MSKLPRDVKKVLMQVAERLPPKYREAKKYSYEEVVDLKHKEVRNNTHGQGFEILTDRKDNVLVSEDVLISSNNHFKKMKKAWFKGGLDAVFKYVDSIRKQNLKLDRTYGTAINTAAINDIIKESIKPII